MSDVHGSKDVLKECSDNIVLNKHGAVVGSTFNNILLALFTLNSPSNKEWRIPGEQSSWQLLEETLCVMLLHIAAVDHVLQRIFNLAIYACFDTSCDIVRRDLTQGALAFLDIWTDKYHKFISREDLCNIGHLLQKFLDQILKYDMTSQDHAPSFFARMRIIILTCSSRSGVNAISPQIESVVSGIWDQSSEKKSFLHGSLESIQQSKTIELRKPADSAPPVIAIFGVTQDMLDHSDDDDYNTGLEEFHKPSVETPVARIPAGYNVLQDYRNVNIWDFDVKEIARQWTLLDHSLFLSVPLASLQRCQWTKPRHISEANEIRRFIDRFNAETCWVTQSLLALESPKIRAALYMKFVFLASFLEELNNYNGLMAILTALQQGCISRLAETLSYVDEKTKLTMKRLQILMSSSMNYKKYKDRLIDLMDDHGISIVPHLGAHLAEISSIEEGNSSYNPNAAHLLNVEKLQLFSRCILRVGKIQEESYNFCSVQLLQICLLSEFRSGQYLSSSEAVMWSKTMFTRSLHVESDTRDDGNTRYQPVKVMSSTNNLQLAVHSQKNIIGATVCDNRSCLL